MTQAEQYLKELESDIKPITTKAEGEAIANQSGLVEAPPAPIPSQTEYQGPSTESTLRDITSLGPFQPGADIIGAGVKNMGQAVGQFGENVYNLFAPEDIETNYYGPARERTSQQLTEMDKALNPSGRALIKPSAFSKSVGTVAEYGLPLAYDIKTIKTSVDTLVNTLSNPKLKDADFNTIINMMGINEEQAKEILKNVPPDQWAKVLAQQGPGKTQQLIKSAIEWDGRDSTRATYIQEMTDRTNAIIGTIKGDNFEKYSQAVRLQYDTMKTLVSEIAFDPKRSYDANSLIGQLKTAAGSKIKPDSLEGKLINVAENLAGETNGNYTIKNLLELKEEANYLYGKASPTEQAKLKTFKNSIDAFIKSNVDETTYAFIEKSTKDYSKMRTYETALDIIDKASVFVGKGAKYGETKATDWNKVSIMFEKEFGNLKKSGKIEEYQVIKNAIDLAKDFELKFGNSEPGMFRSIQPRGVEAINAANERLTGPTPMMAITRSATSKFFDVIMRNLPTEKGRTYSAVRAIKKSIRMSKNGTEFVNNLINNPETPQEVINSIGKIQNSIRENRQKLKELGIDVDTGEKNIFLGVKTRKDAAKKAQGIKLKVEKKNIQLKGKETSIRATQNSIFKKENQIAELEMKLEKMKDEDAIEIIQNKIEALRIDINNTNEKIAGMRQSHAILKDEIDGYNMDIEKLKGFGKPIKPAKRPKIVPKD